MWKRARDGVAWRSGNVRSNILLGIVGKTILKSFYHGDLMAVLSGLGVYDGYRV